MTTNSTIAERADGPPPARRFAVGTGGPGLKLAATCAALVLLFAVLPFFADRGLIQTLFSAMTMLALAQFWNLLAGYAGLVSVGQQGFVGLGGYFLFAAATFAGIDPLLAVPLAGLFAALVALPSAWLIFRLQGAYFAIGTWVLAEVFRLIAAQIKPLGGGTGASLSKTVADKAALTQAIVSVMGMRAPAARDVAAYWLALILAVLATALVLRTAALASRPCSYRDQRQSIGCELARRRSVPSQTDGLYHLRLRSRDGRRAHIFSEGADFARRRLLRHGLDGLRSVHRGHRRGGDG